MEKVTCFVAGIVKGLVEQNDEYRHFGSLMAFQEHKQNALKAGVVKVKKSKESDRLVVTDLGHRWYESAGMKDLASTRSYFWGKDDKFWQKSLEELK